MKTKALYKCDPEKNTSCQKTACQTDCFLTLKKECSVDGVVMYADLETGEIVDANQEQNHMDSGQ